MSLKGQNIEKNGSLTIPLGNSPNRNIHTEIQQNNIAMMMNIHARTRLPYLLSAVARVAAPSSSCEVCIRGA